MSVEGQTWVIVLAGGNGRRVGSLTTGADGRTIPKQFSRVVGGRSMLRWTIDRARQLAPAERVMVVVTESQRRWWAPELREHPRENILSQPANRGTAVAILHALASVLMRDESPLLVVLPSDHAVEDEAALTRATFDAVRVARAASDQLVLIGVAPEGPDSEYGWILPAPGSDRVGHGVASFVEKPSRTAAQSLMEWGALWNSFIFAATGRAMLDVFQHAIPALVHLYFNRFVPTPDADREALLENYRALPERDFGRDLMQREVHRLRVITAPPCGWTDLGTPARLSAWLGRGGGDTLADTRAGLTSPRRDEGEPDAAANVA